MTSPDSLRSASMEVAQLLGLTLSVNARISGKDDFEIRSRDLPYPRSFGVLAKSEYLSWSLELRADQDSRPLLAKMQSTLSSLDAGEIEAYNRQLQDAGLALQINGKSIRELSLEEEWLDFVCTARVDTGQASSEVDKELAGTLLEVWSSALWFIDRFLLDDASNEFSREEGAKSTISCTKYERNRTNRARCLRHFGLRCQGCGELAEDKYGELGRDVIHVHHIVPVSEMGGSKPVDPITDLVPLCPSCHNVVHRENPPVSISLLREVTGFSG